LFRKRRRFGISEVMGSLIMIAITLIAGAAAFGFVNGQTALAAGQIGNGVANNVNYLDEKEIIALVNFDNNTGVSIYVYNNGAETLTISNLILQGPACLGAATNCAAASQGAVVITCAGSSCVVSGTATISPVTTASCTSTQAAGLTPIPISSLNRTRFNLVGCNFVFAASPTLPATTSPPLTNSFTVKVIGKSGSTSTALATR
jgi:flagellin-like protein